MQKIMKKTAVWVLVLALIMSVIPALPGVADEVNAATITQTLDFTKESTPTSGDGYTWNESTSTLTLNGLNLNIGSLYSFGIVIPEKSTIILQGTNNINIPGSEEARGIYCPDDSGEVAIQGTGTLNIDIKSTQYTGYGIYTMNNLVINGGKISIKADSDSGIRCDTFTLNKGELDIKANGGINCWSDVSTNLKITGGKMTADTSTMFYAGEYDANWSLPDEYKYRLSASDPYISYSKTSGGTPYTVTDYSIIYLEIVVDEDEEKDKDIAPAKGTKFNSGNIGYKITNANTNGTGEVAIAGFAGGKAASKLKIGKTVKYEGNTYKITAIGKNAFKNNKKIKTVTIGNNVKVIGSGAFYKAKNLKKITIGTGVTKIGKHAFCHDTKLRTMTIKSKKLKSVGKHSLFKTKKMKIKVPKSKVKKYTKLFKKKGQTKSVKVVKG